MPVNLTGPRIRPASLPERPLPTPSLSPQFGFFAVVATGFALWMVARASLPADLVMPLVATAFLTFAAAFAGVAWWRGRMDPGGVTYRDVAGALTLIGVCAAAAIDPEQMVRIVQVGNASE